MLVIWCNLNDILFPKEFLRLTINCEQELVAKDEAVANEAAAVAGAIKADCEADLAEALPALEAAISALDTLKPSDISQVKNFDKTSWKKWDKEIGKKK